MSMQLMIKIIVRLSFMQLRMVLNKKMAVLIRWNWTKDCNLKCLFYDTGHENIVNLLVQNGADVNAVDLGSHNNKTALLYAAEKGTVNQIKFERLVYFLWNTKQNSN